MIHSMTGYGRHELNLKQANFTIEVKSLNSKQLDTSVKISSVYRDKEITLRKLLSQKLQRGKIELSVWKERHASSFKYSLNTILIKDYFNQIQQLKKELGINGNTLTMNSFEADLIPSLLKMPEVMQKGEDKADENEWKEMAKGVDIAIENTLQFMLYISSLSFQVDGSPAYFNAFISTVSPGCMDIVLIFSLIPSSCKSSSIYLTIQFLVLSIAHKLIQ